jgi:hypothetical protein
VFAVTAHAQFTGPGAVAPVTTVAQLRQARLERYFTVEGKVVAHQRQNYYIFRDGSGEIRRRVAAGQHDQVALGVPAPALDEADVVQRMFAAMRPALPCAFSCSRALTKSMLCALLLWSVAFLHRQRSLKVLGAVGLVASAAPIAKLIVGHLAVGLHSAST